MTYQESRFSTPDGAYLFVHFAGNRPREERLRFALSDDGFHYAPLFGGNDVVLQKKGTGCVRDPYILRGEDGTFYIIGTDMKSDDGWLSNHALVTWRSEDLLHWTDETILDIRDFGGFFADTTRAWAPQAIFDKDKQQYMVYWAHSSGTEIPAALYYAYTSDFKSLSVPQPLYARQGIQTIDGDIVYNENDGYYYLYFKEDVTQSIAWVRSKNLTGPYDAAPPVIASHAPSGVEGSSLFQLHGSDRWLLFMDEYGKERFFLEETTDFQRFTPVPRDRYGFCGFVPRHGSFLWITREEAQRLRTGRIEN